MVRISINELHLKIEMLGGFVIDSGEYRVTDQIRRTSKTWKLIQYMVVNRHRIVSCRELIDIFCDDDEIGNPGSVIRTMIYRARSGLAKGGLDSAEEIIKSHRSGGYSWNKAVSCEVDVEEFESLCNRAGSLYGDEERLELLLQAVEIYRGDFLPDSAGDMWVMPLSRRYRSMYVKSAYDAFNILNASGRSAEAEELCAKVLRIDPFDEEMLENHLRSLLEQGKNSEALEEYKRMETMYYDVLGINFSNNLRALYNKIEHPSLKEENSLETVLSDWYDSAGFPGAFYCDLNVFRAVYQIQARSVSRSGQTAYVVRFETKHDPAAKDGGVMKGLGVAIPAILRKGDLFTRAGPNQYMLMLQTLTYENCRKLVSRILRSVDVKYLSRITGTSIKPIKPVD